MHIYIDDKYFSLIYYRSSKYFQTSAIFAKQQFVKINFRLVNLILLIIFKAYKKHRLESPH